MLFLILQAGGSRYAIDARHAVEILPQVNYNRVPEACAGVAGMFNYHGELVPLIDLSDLIAGKPSQNKMSTRIIVVNIPSGPGNETHLLGLLAEQVTETLRRHPSDFRSPGLVTAASYLGPVMATDAGMIQQIDPTKLLSVDVPDLIQTQRHASE